MKLYSLIIKSLREQLRSFWVLLLTLSMGPFFIFIYYLITETSKPQYDICVVNNDQGILKETKPFNYGKDLYFYFGTMLKDSTSLPFIVKECSTRENGINLLEDKKADVLIVIGEQFSVKLDKKTNGDNSQSAPVEFIGDLTNTKYLLGAVWANEIINEYALQITGSKRIINVKETALGSSGTISDFNMMVPGLLIVSLIMLMFTASIAFVSEVENKTIMRLKLSKLSALQFVGGISIVQLMVGICSVILTLMIALLLGFRYQGSIGTLILIAGLTSLSIIAFSLIIAGITKSANEVLVVGNFPMFLFMFFTGAAFPLKSSPLFTICGYPINFQGLMTPTHAISALNKTLVMNLSITQIIPEIIAILIMTVLYFMVGAWLFNRRHLRVVQ